MPNRGDLNLPLEYYVRNRGVVRGPYTAEKLRELARRGQYGRHYQISRDGETWEPAANHPELLPEAKAGKIYKQPQGPAASQEAGYELAEAEPDAAAPADGGELRLAEETPAARGPSWYYAQSGEEIGPVSFAELRVLASQNQLQYNDLVWTEGMDAWSEAFSVRGLFPEPGEVVTEPQGPLSSPLSGRATQTVSTDQTQTGMVAPLAVASLVLGVLGVVAACVVPGSILAVILGHVALRQIASSQGAVGGRGLALTGLVLGYAAIGIAIIVTFVMILIWVIGFLAGGSA